jgi:hypothetical protein
LLFGAGLHPAFLNKSFLLNALTSPFLGGVFEIIFLAIDLFQFNNELILINITKEKMQSEGSANNRHDLDG